MIKTLIGMCRSFSVDNAVDCRTFIVKLPVSASRLLRELVPASAWIRDPGLRCHVFCVDKSGALLKTHGLSFQHQGDRRSSPSDLMSQPSRKAHAAIIASERACDAPQADTSTSAA